MPAAVAIHHDCVRQSAKRWRNVGFWGVFAILIGPGAWLPDVVAGLLVMVLVGLATLGLKPSAVVAGPGEAPPR
ncbi:5-oxoproline transporter, DUF979 family subunit, partial [Clostridium perfringens]